MGKVIISEALVQTNIDASSKEEVIKVLADKLKAKKYVDDGYYDKVIQREKNYPTGLPTDIPIALCHTERESVLKSALAVGTLKSPVEFQQMGSPELVVKAEIVFLLALNDPKDQIPWLMKMTGVFKSKEVMERVRYARNNKELADTCKDLFL